MYNPHSSLHIFNAASFCEIQLLPFDFSSLTPFRFRRFSVHIMMFFQLVGKAESRALTCLNFIYVQFTSCVYGDVIGEAFH